MFLERGWEFTYETVREWERQFAPLITEQLRTKRRGQAGRSWYVDETYIRVVRRINGRNGAQQKAVRTVGRSFAHLVYPCRIA
jgi:transposase-like protein